MGTDQWVSSTSLLTMHFCQKQHSTKVVLLHKPTFRENSTNEIWKEQGLCWKTDYRLNRIADLPVEALDWDWDEFCFSSEKKIRLHISSCWVKKRLCALFLTWLVYLKCKFLRTKSLIAQGTENWASSEQDFCARNHTVASNRADSSTCSYLDTAVPLPTFYLKRQEQTLWSCSEASPIFSLDLFLQKNWKPDEHYLELLESLNSA